MRGEHSRVQLPRTGWRGRALVASLMVGALAAGSAVIAMTPRSSADLTRLSASPAAVACADPATMPLRAALAQTLMVGAAAPSRKELSLLAELGIGGVFLHGDGSKELTDGRLQRLAAAAVRPLVSVDDEGGRVQRIQALAGSMRSARNQSQTLSTDQVRALARKRGERLLRYGITMDLAPVVDLGGSNPAIGDRSYSGRPKRVTRYAGAFAAGLRDAGVMPTLKHFPGHGRAVGDSHRGQAVTPPVASLRERDWVPYHALVGTGVAVMMGHLTVPGLSSKGLPASLDPAVYRVLRTEIGFSGLIVTDELSNMKAVRDRFGLHEALRRALAAGADLTLFFAEPERVPRLLSRLESDVTHGRLSEARVREAAQRILAAKSCGQPRG
ncbi:MAG TPA: glycoside hydrolase family 3 N-terminal domain-containing protein [Sporichthya sp.]|nr:glycoside hydrolase family 3 N-terminal domain-containing protein [Sporichthya sp.]